MTGSVPLRDAQERADAEEIIAKETTQMYRAPEMVDLYMREQLTVKTDIWVCIWLQICVTFKNIFAYWVNACRCEILVGIGMYFLRIVLPHPSFPRGWHSRNSFRKIFVPSVFKSSSRSSDTNHSHV